MNLNKKMLFVLTVVLFTSLDSVLSQAVYDLNFQGMLADIQGKSIHDESFDLAVQLRSLHGSEVLFEFKSSRITDREGFFGFTISEISQFLLEDGSISKPIVIRMEFQPNENTRWMKKGEDFMITYTLTPHLVEDTIQMTMTRMEGSELLVYSEPHFQAFKDELPFAYLTGGFLVTLQSPLDSQSVENLKLWLLPGEFDESGAPSRGVKGGFPKGGYHRKN